jgi:hypothetical protein
MPRDLKRSDKNEIRIKDSVSGETIVLYYRQPTAEEHVKYHSDVTKFTDGKVEIDQKARIDHAANILTGFRDGDIVLDGNPVSCAEGQRGYRDVWRELIKDTAADWLMILAGLVFEATYREETGVPFVKR